MKVSSPSSSPPSPVADSAAGSSKVDKTRQPATPRSPGRKGDAALNPLALRRASTGTRAADANVEAPRGSVAGNVRPRRTVDAATAQSPPVRAPANIKQGMAGRVEPQSRAQLPAANPTIGRGLRPPVLSDDFARHAASVDSLKQFQQLVRAIASQPASASRAAPLSVLLQRIGFLPPADISTAFHAALGAIRTLDVADQDAPLVALANNLGAVPASERYDAIAALLEALAS